MRPLRLKPSFALKPIITMTTPSSRSLLAATRCNPGRPLARLYPLVWVALLAAVSGRAEAADKLVTVFEPKVEGTLAADERSRFDSAVAEALRELQYQTVSAGERDTIINGEGVQNCFTEECQERIGRLLGSQAVLVYKLKVTRPDGSPPPTPAPAPAAAPKKKGAKAAASKDPQHEIEPEPAGASNASWGLTVSLFNVEVGATGATAKADCAKCTATMAAQNLGELVRKIILEDAGRPRGTLEILSDPANASVFVDGHEIGVTPYKRVAFAGKHEVTVRKTGHKSKQETVNVIDSQKTLLQVKLVQGQDDRVVLVTERMARPKWRVGLGVAALAAGAITLGFGGRALDLNGHCIDTPMGMSLKCSNVFDTQGIGVGLVAGGAALSIVGIIAISLPGRAHTVEKQLPSGSASGDQSQGTPATPVQN